ncbi:zinc-finger domain-containing protein [Maritalea mediterranea]|uniref:Zinc-finger domain-containing protein n=1 Tax=Maritalea mediterranea TaxID=2909667 RepID=A0ABS9E952_9HYPH|nr:zinc-finger domain-containing protein [Maritalea mediterranea]MCF4098737.1 zinc-finger domain-containing protein [Maritalea mediterranea]
MANQITPHFQNSMGVAKIEIGTKEFKCIGALPPYDHPHVYLDMGDENEIVCPYCSTHFVHNADLKPAAASPAEAAYNKQSA